MVYADYYIRSSDQRNAVTEFFAGFDQRRLLIKGEYVIRVSLPPGVPREVLNRMSKGTPAIHHRVVAYTGWDWVLVNIFDRYPEQIRWLTYE